MGDMQPRTVHHTELPAAPPGAVLGPEWETYRREVARLLAEGHEGKFVLIKGQQILAVYPTWATAREAGLRLYLRQPFLVRQVCADEPLLRVRGYSLPDHISRRGRPHRHRTARDPVSRPPR